MVRIVYFEMIAFDVHVAVSLRKNASWKSTCWLNSNLICCSDDNLKGGMYGWSKPLVCFAFVLYSEGISGARARLCLNILTCICEVRV